MSVLTLKRMKLVADVLKAKAIKPGRIETQQQAEAINAAEKLYGLSHDWRVGDDYYMLGDVRGVGR